MRILVVANLPPHVIGGAEIQVLRMVEKWLDAGHQVEVAGHRIPSGILEAGRHCIRIHGLYVTKVAGRIGRAASYFFSLARLMLRKHRSFDIIYCRGLGDAALSICLLKWMGLPEIRLVACPTGAGFMGTADFLRSIPGWHIFMRLVDRYCDALISIAPAITDELKVLGLSRPSLSQIPNGVKLDAPIMRQRSVVEKLVCVGRLNREKGIDVLLNALFLLKKNGRRFSCNIVGDGPEQHSLISTCKQLGLGDLVRFLGGRSPADIRAILAESDLFVLSSRAEGMSNAALEAMEASLPVVLTRCGGIDTYVNERIGWVCERDDPIALANALNEALGTDQDKLLAMGRTARKLVEDRFDIEVTSMENIGVFNNLLRDRVA